MIRKHIYFDEEQLHFLDALPGMTSEHIRQALDEYIEKKRRSLLNVSESPSKGGQYGRTTNKPSPTEKQ